MKWELRIAAILSLLIVLLAVKGLWVRHGGETHIPILVEWGAPFYPVYFASADGEFLAPEFHPGEGDVDRILADLIEGPKTSGLGAVIPAEVRVLSCTRQGSVLFVNFSHHLRTNHPGGSRAELLTIYAIVNTLTEIAGIDRVQILIEYERSDTLTGHINLGEPLERDHTILNSILI